MNCPDRTLNSVRILVPTFYKDSSPLYLMRQLIVWSDDEDYENCKRFCCDLMVTNDPAERAVKDVQDCAQVTRDPAHRDSVILVRTDHRGRVVQLRKADLDNV